MCRKHHEGKKSRKGEAEVSPYGKPNAESEVFAFLPSRPVSFEDLLDPFTGPSVKWEISPTLKALKAARKKGY